MDYICRNHERVGTCYHEFVSGEWDGVNFWDDGSLFMHDEIFDAFPEFLKLWMQAVPEFESCGINRIDLRQWKTLREAARVRGGVYADFVSEMDPWMDSAFRKAAFVTILGI